MIVILGLCFLLIDWLSFGEGGGGWGIRLKLDVQGQGGGGIRNFGLSWTMGLWGLGNWTVFMDVICVSFLNLFIYLKIHTKF